MANYTGSDNKSITAKIIKDVEAMNMQTDGGIILFHTCYYSKVAESEEHSGDTSYYHGRGAKQGQYDKKYCLNDDQLEHIIVSILGELKLETFFRIANFSYLGHAYIFFSNPTVVKFFILEAQRQRIINRESLMIIEMENAMQQIQEQGLDEFEEAEEIMKCEAYIKSKYADRDVLPFSIIKPIVLTYEQQKHLMDTYGETVTEFSLNVNGIAFPQQHKKGENPNVLYCSDTPNYFTYFDILNHIANYLPPGTPLPEVTLKEKRVGGSKYGFVTFQPNSMIGFVVRMLRRFTLVKTVDGVEHSATLQMNYATMR
jgi:hypothetical protein